MDIDRLADILHEATTELRKGEVLEGTPELVEQVKRGDEELTAGGVLEVYAMPHVDEAPEGLELVDVEFIVIGVRKAIAEQRKAELVELLKTYPNPRDLSGGPSYITVGGALGSQDLALQLFALGKVLGLWDVITSATMGMTGCQARQMAGMGFVMITGFNATQQKDPRDER